MHADRHRHTLFRLFLPLLLLFTLWCRVLLLLRCVQEGAGHAVMSAYVEIVFDNSDERIPVRHK